MSLSTGTIPWPSLINPKFCGISIKLRKNAKINKFLPKDPIRRRVNATILLDGGARWSGLDGGGVAIENYIHILPENY